MERRGQPSGTILLFKSLGKFFPLDREISVSARLFRQEIFYFWIKVALVFQKKIFLPNLVQHTMG